MFEDAITVRVAVCGSLPKLAEWLESCKVFERNLFRDGWALRDRLLNARAEPMDMALVESNCGCGLGPLYIHTARGDCPVLMVTDASLHLVSVALDKIYQAKCQQLEQEQIEFRKGWAEALLYEKEGNCS